MNDEGPSSSAVPNASSAERVDDTAAASSNDLGPGESDVDHQRKKVAEKRATNLEDIIRELDVLVYAQLAAVYYLEYVYFCDTLTPTVLTSITAHLLFVSSFALLCNYSTLLRNRRWSLHL